MNQKSIPHEKLQPFLKKLKEIYEEMDAAYKKAALNYGFECNGCEDNCCLTRFYHHTFAEYFYLLKGLNGLNDSLKKEIMQKADIVCGKTKELESKGEKIRLMCPLNFDGLCILYKYRPMICRLHGIAHELHRPNNPVFYGSGCEAFTKHCEKSGLKYYPFDRTPFYISMAELENSLKKEIKNYKKIKMTISEMILSY